MNNQMMNNGQINRGAANVRMGNAPQNGGKRMPQAAKNNPKYTENWLNLRAINNGIMYVSICCM